MTRLLATADRILARLDRARIGWLSVFAALVVGAADYFTGHEVSMSLFYLAPVALATWYGGRWPGIGMALMSCLMWYSAQLASGYPFTHPAIPIWNALIRFGFFSVTSLLLTTLRGSLLEQERLARTDALTGLYGRRAFEERLEHELARAQRRRSPLTLAYLDLDNFKLVNDTFGHAEGDRVLQTTALALSKAIRQTDTAARLGGDEFALLLPEANAQGAERVIDDLSSALQKAFAGSSLDLSCSIGVVTFVQPGVSMPEAIAAADSLMYEVKRKGKGAVAFRVVEGPAQERADDEQTAGQ